MSDTASQPSTPTSAPALRSVHSTTFPELLRTIGSSLLVSTYEVGKLAVLRAGNGPLNALYRTFQKPMGVAAARDRLAIGTYAEIWEYQNAPRAYTIADQVEPLGKHDGCYLPRSIYFTGDIQIHEMAWGGAEQEELWFVNTRFSCLCTRSAKYSFRPRWQPSFITSLAPEDRCHLNGMGMRDGVPRYATALGESDGPSSWRQNKKNGGILIDVQSNQVIARGLSMPHSPRWYNGRLWMLESGFGRLGYIEPSSGKFIVVTELPGFTRGLDFSGPFAFVGLSQVRGNALISDVAITSKPIAERHCGVWVVDLQSGNVVAFLKFETDAVQEIFAVQVLPNMKWPDVVTEDLLLRAQSFVPVAPATWE